MANIRIVILGPEVHYWNLLAEKLAAGMQRCDVELKHTAEDFIRHISGSGADMLIIDGLLYTEDVGGAARDSAASVKIILDGNKVPSDTPHGWLHMYRLGKVPDTVRDIKTAYAERAGKKPGNSAVSSAAFYSPVGGSGKTTLALGCAYALTRRRLRVFYLGFEKISAATVFLSGRHSETLSDVVESLKHDEQEIISAVRQAAVRDSRSGIHYFHPPDNKAVFDGFDRGGADKLLKALAGCAEFDYLIIDLSGDYTESNMEFLKESGAAVIPFTPGEISHKKMEAFAAALNKTYKKFIVDAGKLIPVLNKADRQAREPAAPPLLPAAAIPFRAALDRINGLDALWEELCPDIDNLTDIISHVADR